MAQDFSVPRTRAFQPFSPLSTPIGPNSLPSRPESLLRQQQNNPFPPRQGQFPGLVPTSPIVPANPAAVLPNRPMDRTRAFVPLPLSTPLVPNRQEQLLRQGQDSPFSPQQGQFPGPFPTGPNVPANPAVVVQDFSVPRTRAFQPNSPLQTPIIPDSLPPRQEQLLRQEQELEQLLRQEQNSPFSPQQGQFPGLVPTTPIVPSKYQTVVVQDFSVPRTISPHSTPLIPDSLPPRQEQLLRQEQDSHYSPTQEQFPGPDPTGSIISANPNVVVQDFSVPRTRPFTPISPLSTPIIADSLPPRQEQLLRQEQNLEQLLQQEQDIPFSPTLEQFPGPVPNAPIAIVSTDSGMGIPDISLVGTTAFQPISPLSTPVNPENLSSELEQLLQQEQELEQILQQEQNSQFPPTQEQFPGPVPIAPVVPANPAVILPDIPVAGTGALPLFQSLPTPVVPANPEVLVIDTPNAVTGDVLPIQPQDTPIIVPANQLPQDAPGAQITPLPPMLAAALPQIMGPLPTQDGQVTPPNSLPISILKAILAGAIPQILGPPVPDSLSAFPAVPASIQNRINDIPSTPPQDQQNSFTPFQTTFQ